MRRKKKQEEEKAEQIKRISLTKAPENQKQDRDEKQERERERKREREKKKKLTQRFSWEENGEVGKKKKKTETKILSTDSYASPTHLFQSAIFYYSPGLHVSGPRR